MNGEMDSIKMKEKAKGPGISVLKQYEKDGSLMLVLSCEDRSTLANDGRTFALNFVRQADSDSKLGSWKNAGAEKVTPIFGYDPDNPDENPYELAADAPDTKWHYQQTIKLTNSIF